MRSALASGRVVDLGTSRHLVLRCAGSPPFRETRHDRAGMRERIDLSSVDLNLLVLFEAVLDERHVGRAAKRLHLTPSAVSHGLGRLRRLLDDPVFLRVPKGVVPSERALALAEPIAEILARVRGVLGAAEPFDPRRSARRFVLGATDGIATVLLSPLIAHLHQSAPHVDVVVRPIEQEGAIADLDRHAIDVAILATPELPARLVSRVLYEERFVVAMRAGHPLASRMTLAGFCAAQHVLVSLKGDARGFVDDALAARGASRRVAVAVPNFFSAMAVVAETELVAALPRRMVELHAARFGIVAREPPLPLPVFPIHALTPEVALADAGLAWLFDAIAAAARTAAGPAPREAAPRSVAPRGPRRKR